MNFQLSKFLAAIIFLSFAGNVACSQDQQTSSHQSTESESKVLFDGSSLKNFRGYKTEELGSGWSIDNGTLRFSGKGGGQDIITKEKYASFELTFDWKVSPGANSGVMYRVTTGDDAPYFSGPEYQILDDGKHPDGGNDKTSAASLYGLYSAKDKQLKPVGEWNSAKVVVDGDKVEHWLNGKKVVSTEIGSDDWNSKVADSKFKDWKKFGVAKTGHICFQDHGDEFWLRDIRIRTID